MTLRIKEVLSKKGITGSALSEMMSRKGKDYKLSTVSISNILSGKQSPKVETLEKIADTLGIDVAEFFESFVPAEMTALYEKDEKGDFIEIGMIKK